ncbi:MAG TPA: nitroreductase family deazaflavin-dependent oxidoreductase [Myxococcota bacterium]|nr:nitroreductase family deazaflavin-dependent oxidoreductase [Myxococcota bacterium]
MRRTPIVELFWKVHPWLYRRSGGRLLGKLVDMKVLLLATTGAKSGAPRTTALTYLEADGAYVVIGSFLGEPRHPAWVHNLRAHPRASVQVGVRVIPVTAREARGQERARLWQQLVALQPDYRAYEHRTDREIPVVVLEPTPA